MCGLVGFLDVCGFATQNAARCLIETMRDQIAHRGPDDSGIWLDPTGVAFGFRRLSIIDLSASGHQPALSADGRYVVMMNGEIYNFTELRSEIETVRGRVAWRGHSDTEILVEAIALWGIEAAVTRANGMFALAVWDRQDRVLWLARDRVGKKPLHYGWASGSFVFASELKALFPHPDLDFSVSPDALADYLQLGYVPAPGTIFRAIGKLRPGHILKLDHRAATRRETPESRPYWDLRDAARRGLDDQLAGRTPDAEELEATLLDAVAKRMVADVPLGAFLSGGIDSSLITSIMAQRSRGSVRSFSVGFRSEAYDEGPHAKAVAAHLGTEHRETRIDGAEAMRAIGDIAGICDEPFADPSIIPTTLLSRLARENVTVALSGDGGDELFGGYERYAIVERYLSHRRLVPEFARPLAQALRRRIGVPVARTWGTARFERHMNLLGCLLDDDQPERFNEALLSPLIDPAALLAQPAAARHPLMAPEYRLDRSTVLERLLFTDTKSYLADDILAKVDRASMSTGLEVRCPLLDYRLIEMSWRFPAAAKMAGGVGKLPLREILYRRVPRALVDRPKMGFGAPVELWLRAELRDWAEDLMSREALSQHGLLNVDACRRLWEDFAERGRGWTVAIWHVLMFQAWHARIAAVTRGVKSPADGPGPPAGPAFERTAYGA
jgi:asparagine synthase (glutamine-hydrolysing)